MIEEKVKVINKSGAREMVQHTTGLATKLDDKSSILKTYTVEGQNQLFQAVL